MITTIYTKSCLLVHMVTLFPEICIVFFVILRKTTLNLLVHIVTLFPEACILFFVIFGGKNFKI